jgi:hypothetical protein
MKPMPEHKSEREKPGRELKVTIESVVRRRAILGAGTSPGGLYTRRYTRPAIPEIEPPRPTKLSRYRRTVEAGRCWVDQVETGLGPDPELADQTTQLEAEVQRLRVALSQINDQIDRAGVLPQ